MLRSILIYFSKAAWAQRIVTRWKVAWRVASRFVAGETVEDAMRVIQELNALNINATSDHLGEHTSTTDEAQQATQDILELIAQINKTEVRSNVSIKLTQLGLALDENIAAQNLERILVCARDHNNYVRIDMEDTPYTDKTICLYRLMRREGFDNVGIVLQSYLYRTVEDTRQLLEEDTRFRLVKGAYREPPEMAFVKKRDSDTNFDLITKLILDAALDHSSPTISADGRIPPLCALGTHDEKRINYAKDYARKINLPKAALEFQMLFGIRRDLQVQLAKEGYPVRVYVPYGTHWYPFFVRRLAERPANLWFFLSNFLEK